MWSNLKISLLTAIISSALASIYPSFLRAGDLNSSGLNQALGETISGLIYIIISLIALVIALVITWIKIKEKPKNKLLFLLITFLVFMLLSLTNPFFKLFTYWFKSL